MVIAHKMQKAMHGKMRKMVEENTVLVFAFAQRSFLQQFREQAGTFADSIKLWGGA